MMTDTEPSGSKSPARQKEQAGIFSSIEAQLTPAGNEAGLATLWTLTEERLVEEVEGGPSIWKDLEPLVV